MITDANADQFNGCGAVNCLAADTIRDLRLALADAERKRQEWRQLAEALADNASFRHPTGRWECCCCACRGDTPGNIDHSPACAVYLVGCAAAPGEATCAEK
jgi:hypothetical protein